MTDKIMNKFGNLIRKRRREKEITQEKLSKIVGVSRPVIWAWEKGLYEPNGKNILLLMKELNIKPEDFNKGEERAKSSI